MSTQPTSGIHRLANSQTGYNSFENIEGVNAFIGDILDPDSLYAALADCDCALHLATAIPRDRISNLLSRWNSRYRIAISNGVYSAAVITSGIFNYGIYNTPGAET
jgi:hypothetical protein